MADDVSNAALSHLFGRPRQEGFVEELDLYHPTVDPAAGIDVFDGQVRAGTNVVAVGRQTPGHEAHDAEFDRRHLRCADLYSAARGCLALTGEG